MKKAEVIRRYGKEAWATILAQNNSWKQNNQEKVKAHRIEHERKGGKYYEQELEYDRTGLRGERQSVRSTHRTTYYPYKRHMDPLGLSQIHHEWIPGTADYRALALVEADQHRHGTIDVIQILEGEITCLTEADVAKGGCQNAL